MLAALLRTFAQESPIIASGASLSGAIDMRKLTMGVLHMPAAWTAASIGFHVCSTQGGSFQPLYDKNGSLVQISSPAAACAYVLPADLAGCHWIKLWSQDGAGSGANQAAARSFTLDMKA